MWCAAVMRNFKRFKLLASVCFLFNTIIPYRAYANTAYVFIGDFNGTPGSGYTGRAAENSANEAQSDYEDAGYTIVRDDMATIQDFMDALADPDAMAIWFFGHGLYDSVRGKKGKEKLTDPIEGIGLTDGSKLGTDVPGTYPNLKNVTFHACGQDLQSWKDKFPNAEFNAWSRGVRAWEIWWWQFFKTYMSLGANTMSSTDSLNTPVINSRLEQTGQFAELGNKFICDLAPVSNNMMSFVLEDEWATAFEGSSFNFSATNGLESELLFATTISDGVIDFSTQSLDPLTNPDFEITIGNNSIFTLLEDPDMWSSISASSDVEIINNTGGAKSDQMILDAFGVVTFGTSKKVPEPSSTLGFLTFGILGAGSLLKGKLKEKS